jgi:hypothetical protein
VGLLEPHLPVALAGDDAEATGRRSDGTVVVFVGRHGAMNPAGRVRCNIVPIARDYNRASIFFICVSHASGA